MEILKVVGLSKKYEGANALENISFEIEKGEFVSILGPSGCGKTTLLRILIGLIAPDSGKIYLEDKDITSARPSERIFSIIPLVRSVRSKYISDSRSSRFIPRIKPSSHSPST